MADFNPKTMTVKELKNASVETLKTELPNLANALGVSPGELFRALSGSSADDRAIGDLQNMRRLADCCSSDNW
ncbi:MAG: hypothetical protein EPO51_19910 [Phenylobacterium sp.]|uniref:hypothetical protein n=1 Tax=Phenylobacterium sp. TaxID=1871053 RepID=UPI00122405FC|nr:hypothetical protein [Phenylobacterium sp.]TAJ69797.1 MAG: hypothetical protein EPO51_19910 [Phenylobacterium sp.]